MQPFADIGSSEIFKCTCNKSDLIFKCKLLQRLDRQKCTDSGKANRTIY